MTDSLFSYFICRSSPGTRLWSFPRAPSLSFTYSFSDCLILRTLLISAEHDSIKRNNKTYKYILYAYHIIWSWNSKQLTTFLVSLWEVCFYFIYCRFSLGVKEIVKTKESFLQRHQLPSAPSGHYWCIVGTAWWGQWLATNNEAGGQHKGHAHCMMGKSRGGSRCCHRGHTGGERETADVSLSISISDGFVLCLATGEKRQQLYLLLTERVKIHHSRFVSFYKFSSIPATNTPPNFFLTL